ncbi:efflux RND transporter periplasmic adaptor subunit [Pseudomaricurvus alcaniphilus]|uniref:efflux RND transporter periplasmic adaptor subunit n=1 Tax=Pseudomaricurvus alcaniphilus TaxID=1166482 RepID=UPI00140D61FE|nr:efflux RND transporter periplasmic adaptor subunit [Pseudomaricurvus alcaniphilus]
MAFEHFYGRQFTRPVGIVTLVLTSILAPVQWAAADSADRAKAAQGGAGIDAQADILPVDCVINPYKTIEMSSAVPGVIDNVKVERSQFVQRGQVVAELDAGVERATVALAKRRAAIEADTQVSLINLNYDEREQRRIDSLYQKKAVTFRHKDDADREAQLSAWKLRQARDLEEIRALELARAEEQLKQKTIRSTIDGFVSRIYKSSGEYIEDQPILQIVQINPLRIEAIVPMSLFGRIQPGMVAEVAPEAASSGKHHAEVTVVDRIGDAASGTFGVRLELPNENYQLPAGLKCGLRFLNVEEQAAYEQSLEPQVSMQAR